MKKMYFFLSTMLLSVAGYSQMDVSMNAGLLRPIKINYNKNSVSGTLNLKFQYTEDHKQGGVMLMEHFISGSSYKTLTDIVLYANYVKRGEQSESYFYAGLGLGYGITKAGKGASAGIQLGYSIAVAPKISVNLETDPRAYYLIVNENNITDVPTGKQINTWDRFILVPVTVGVKIALGEGEARTYSRH